MLRDALAAALRSALIDLEVRPVPDVIRVDRPGRPEHGDWYSNVALVASKSAGRPPRELASAVREHLLADPPPYVADVEVAGNGFINFRLDDAWLHDVLRQVVDQGTERYARHDLGDGERLQIEFVSANPTGPIHVGNGWWCAYGDALGRVMERSGWLVHREYYVNDTGGQIRQLGQSLLARRRGEEVSGEGYRGAYVTDLAQEYHGPHDDVMAAGRWAAERNIANIRETLESIGVLFDEWFSQASIEEGGAVEETIAQLKRRGVVFEQDGAVWLRSTDFGDSRDRVLIKANGDFTYLAGDLAYHHDKFCVRNFDRVIDVFGADHHGQVASLQAGVEALGIDRDRLEIKLGQMISLAEGRMSRRAGNFIALSDLVADIGPDAFRLLSLISSIDQATTIDLETVRRQTMENPVYYVQYAHARIASIERVAAERGVERQPLGTVDLSLLTHPRELGVLRSLAALPDVVLDACVSRAPHKITTWVRELADRFHGFYHDCYVMGEDVPPELTQARLWLVEAARVGLAIGLDLLGVDAPEAM